MTATFEALFRSLDFERPLDVETPSDRALYVDGMHTSEGISPVDELRVGIEMSDRPGTWLFTGHRGVGKSTELRRMAADLREQGYMVIVADMGEYLNLVEPVKTETLLLTLVAALADGADEFLGGNRLGPGGYAKRLWKYLTHTNVEWTEVSVQADAGNAAKLSLKAQLKDNPTFRDKVVEALQGSIAPLATQVRDFAQSVLNDLHAQRGADKQIVLILDSLERLRVTGTDAQVCYDAISRTFDQNADYLKLEHIHVVYSVPPYLPFLLPRIGSYFGVSVCTLPHVKVFQTPEGTALRPADGPIPRARPDARGLDLMVQAVCKRYPQVLDLLPRPLLEELALASSGSVRDYFRLVRSVCTKARVASQTGPLQGNRWAIMAQQVLRNEMPLATEDKSWLRNVRRTHGNGLDSMAHLHQLARLFDSGVILNYRNGRDWCDVHYLLQDELGE
ncbi:hypothetical protein M4R22_07640 [Acidovorax sp. GBBC 3334]|uniref:hypothetical protein n=1 Tax=unclassified Acidovorax TaxID=2684926 RepID=UPI002302EE2F|nr:MULTISPECIES: hypothetical protein [unclassified Acidovorax]MDA8454631.1 hypothetical protein [Acidovorax sp. GBBC 3334]MDA8519746.1 hypothetical protein [Acidovorax sp. NCPPB 4044]